MASGRELKVLKAGYVQSIAFTPDGQKLFIATMTEVLLWDIASGTVLRRFEVRNSNVNSLALSRHDQADLEEYESAVAAYKSEVSLGPGQSRPRFNLGLAYLGLGRKGEALAEFEEAVRLNPKYAEARYDLAVIALNLGDRQGAAAQQRELQRLNAELAARLADLMK